MRTAIAVLMYGQLYPVDTGRVRRAETVSFELEVAEHFSANFPVSANNDVVVFRCNCGSTEFTLRRDGAYCRSCGCYAHGWVE